MNGNSICEKSEAGTEPETEPVGTEGISSPSSEIRMTSFGG